MLILSLYFRKIRYLSHAPIQRMKNVNRVITKLVCMLIKKTPWVDALDVLNGADCFVVAGTPIFYILPDSTFENKIALPADRGRT